MPEGGDREAYLTADYNAEMIEHIARYPRIRDTSIFVGDPGDIVPGTFGPGLPEIRAWTEQNFDFCGYITGLDQPRAAERAALREAGYSGTKICIIPGPGVGALCCGGRRHLPLRQLPELRMIMVAGPRIDGNSLPCRYRDPRLCAGPAQASRGLRHRAGRGRLTTTLGVDGSAHAVPLFPLRNHFEQNVHVRHRLSRYRAGRARHDTATPDGLPLRSS
jgi:hypothetical protein